MKPINFLLLIFFIANATLASNKNCLCYCSYKPGPRQAQADDNPRVISSKTLQPSNKSYEICFCKQRDIDKFRDDPKVIKKVTESDLKKLDCCEDEELLWLM